jgi:hypothetical protein
LCGIRFAAASASRWIVPNPGPPCELFLRRRGQAIAYGGVKVLMITVVLLLLPRNRFLEAYSRPLVTASSTSISSALTSTTSTSYSTSNHLQSRVCCTVSIPFASLPAHAMMNVWICSSFVVLACVGFVDPSCIFGVLAYLFLFASSFPGSKLILDHVNFVTIHNVCCVALSVMSHQF